MRNIYYSMGVSCKVICPFFLSFIDKTDIMLNRDEFVMQKINNKMCKKHVKKWGFI